ncbi:MAG: hypothetical protein ACYTJ0_18190, partial [Planctomycetota bacterium]
MNEKSTPGTSTLAAALLIATSGLAALPSTVAGQTTIHVDPCGNDAWTGESPDCGALLVGPMLTIQAAIDA